MASITKRGDTFRITISLGVDGTGKRLRHTETFTPTKTGKAAEREAKHYAEVLEEQYRKGVLTISENIEYADFCKRWYDNWAIDKLKQNQAEAYLSSLELHVIPVLGKMRLNSIRKKDCQQVIDKVKERGLAPKTQRAIASAMHSTFRYALRLDLISIDPCSTLDLQSLKKAEKIKCFDVEQSQRFLSCLSMKFPQKMGGRKRKDSNGKEYTVKPYVRYVEIPFAFQVFFHLSLLGGFRRAELVALNWSDVDFTNRTIKIDKSMIKTKKYGQIISTPKTPSSYRTVYLPQNCIDMLEELLDMQKEQCVCSNWKGMPLDQIMDNPIFTQQDGTRMFLDSPTAKFAKIITAFNSYIEEQAELLPTEEMRKLKLQEKLPEITLHDLRHSFCTILIASGVDVVTVSKLAGHSSPSVTADIYSHLLRKNAKDAAMTFEKIFTPSKQSELRA